MELEARFKVRSGEAFGKVFGGTEAIRLLLRFKIDSFGSRLNWTRLRRTIMMRMVIKIRWSKLPEGSYSVMSKVELDQRVRGRSSGDFKAGQLVKENWIIISGCEDNPFQT